MKIETKQHPRTSSPRVQHAFYRPFVRRVPIPKSQIASAITDNKQDAGGKIPPRTPRRPDRVPPERQNDPDLDLHIANPKSATSLPDSGYHRLVENHYLSRLLPAQAAY